jgi:hypothetical protein
MYLTDYLVHLVEKGAYHWDEFNPNEKIRDHASESAHLLIHIYNSRIIRIFYE